MRGRLAHWRSLPAMADGWFAGTAPTARIPPLGDNKRGCSPPPGRAVPHAARRATRPPRLSPPHPTATASRSHAEPLNGIADWAAAPPLDEYVSVASSSLDNLEAALEAAEAAAVDDAMAALASLVAGATAGGAGEPASLRSVAAAAAAAALWWDGGKNGDGAGVVAAIARARLELGREEVGEKE